MDNVNDYIPNLFVRAGTFSETLDKDPSNE